MRIEPVLWQNLIWTSHTKSSLAFFFLYKYKFFHDLFFIYFFLFSLYFSCKFWFELMGIQPLTLTPHWLFSFSTNTNFFTTYFLFIYFYLHYVLLIVCHCVFFATINFCFFYLFCWKLNPFYLQQKILLKYVKSKSLIWGAKIIYTFNEMGSNINYNFKYFETQLENVDINSDFWIHSNPLFQQTWKQ